MSDEKFMTKILVDICNYAVENKYDPNETLKQVAENILAILEIATFKEWKVQEEE